MHSSVETLPNPDDFSDVLIQDFMKTHAHEDVSALALQYSGKTDFDLKLALTQIKLRKRASEKLPDWVSAECLFGQIPLEQCSSQSTAKWKAEKISSLLRPESILDCNAGLGVDSYAFAGISNRVISIEKSEALHKLGQYNFNKLGLSNISAYPGDVKLWLKENAEQSYDLVYADPDRRSGGKEKNADLRLSEPSPESLQEILKGKYRNMLIKLSPAFDPQEAIRRIAEVKEVWIVSVKHECKEILILTEPGYTGPVLYRAAAWLRGSWHEACGMQAYKNEQWLASQYILLPDVAFVLSGLTSKISAETKANCDRGRLLCSDVLPDTFPGTCWRLQQYFEGSLHACLKQFRSAFPKAIGEISAPNTGLSFEMLKKNMGVKPGGSRLYYWLKTDTGFVCMVLSLVQVQ
jgi:hypothetical protein